MKSNYLIFNRRDVVVRNIRSWLFTYSWIHVVSNKMLTHITLRLHTLTLDKTHRNGHDNLLEVSIKKYVLLTYGLDRN